MSRKYESKSSMHIFCQSFDVLMSRAVLKIIMRMSPHDSNFAYSAPLEVHQTSTVVSLLTDKG